MFCIKRSGVFLSVDIHYVISKSHKNEALALTALCGTQLLLARLVLAIRNDNFAFPKLKPFEIPSVARFFMGSNVAKFLYDTRTSLKIWPFPNIQNVISQLRARVPSKNPDPPFPQVEKTDPKKLFVLMRTGRI